MKNRPLKIVGVFLLLVAIFLVFSMKEKPETTINVNSHVGLIETMQEVSQKQELKKYRVSVQLNPVFPDSE